MDVAGFRFDSPFLCRDCQYIRDMIWKLAQTQGKLQWQQKTFASNESTLTVCAAYRSHRAAKAAGEPVPRKFPLIDILQIMRKTVGTDNQAEIKVMNRRQFMARVTVPLF